MVWVTQFEDVALQSFFCQHFLMYIVRGYLKSNANSITDLDELQFHLHGSWICHLDSTSGTDTCTWEMGFGINMDESYIIKLKHVFTRLLDFMK